MDDVLFVWTASYQTCLMLTCVPRLLTGLYQLFHLCLIKHVLNVSSLTSTLACFGHQTKFDGAWLPKIVGIYAGIVTQTYRKSVKVRKWPTFESSPKIKQANYSQRISRTMDSHWIKRTQTTKNEFLLICDQRDRF